MKSTLTDAQVRVMKAIRRSGHAPSNSTIPLLNRLAAKGLIRWLPLFDETGSLIHHQPRRNQLELTEAGVKALDEVEIDQACRDLGARLNGLLM